MKNNSNYARKSRYLAHYNNRPADESIAGKDDKGAKVWGFDFPKGSKPWK